MSTALNRMKDQVVSISRKGHGIGVLDAEGVFSLIILKRVKQYPGNIIPVF